ncbi:MAG TPA: hypothetical protein VML55_17905 [Planctomycetaceae bacterium]|nr:hypothetical protein [Planctomycetaceae bacterium]
MSTHQLCAQRRDRCIRVEGPGRRLGRRVLAGVTLALASVWAAGAAHAGPAAYTIEEDWVVEIGTPDAAGSAPQIVTAMSSTLQLADVHAVFEINHTSLPSFTPGGLQLQVWSGDDLLVYKNSSKTGTLNTLNEVITFKQVMKLSSGKVEFTINSGASTTWGTFGTSGILKASLDTTQVDLSNYSPDVSVQNSYVGFAKHRVKKLALKEVRYYDKFGNLIQHDTTERIVHQLSN